MHALCVLYICHRNCLSAFRPSPAATALCNGPYPLTLSDALQVLSSQSDVTTVPIALLELHPPITAASDAAGHEFEFKFALCLCLPGLYPHALQFFLTLKAACASAHTGIPLSHLSCVRGHCAYTCHSWPAGVPSLPTYRGYSEYRTHSPFWARQTTTHLARGYTCKPNQVIWFCYFALGGLVCRIVTELRQHSQSALKTLADSPMPTFTAT